MVYPSRSDIFFASTSPVTGTRSPSRNGVWPGFAKQAGKLHFTFHIVSHSPFKILSIWNLTKESLPRHMQYREVDCTHAHCRITYCFKAFFPRRAHNAHPLQSVYNVDIVFCTNNDYTVWRNLGVVWSSIFLLFDDMSWHNITYIIWKLDALAIVTCH